MMKKFLVLLFVLFFKREALCECQFPAELDGEWFSVENSLPLRLGISGSFWNQITGPKDSQASYMTCKDIFIHPRRLGQDDTQGNNMTILMEYHNMKHTNEIDGTVNVCVDILWRSINVVQYRKEYIVTYEGENVSLFRICPSVRNAYKGEFNLPTTLQTTTMYRWMSFPMRCSEIVRPGVYQFDYEKFGMNEVCSNPRSLLTACPSRREDKLIMSYATCDDDNTTVLTFECLGSWKATMNGQEYTYAALQSLDIKDIEESFKCMMTNKNATFPDGKERWAMSTDCNQLYGILFASEKITISKASPEMKCEK